MGDAGEVKMGGAEAQHVCRHCGTPVHKEDGLWWHSEECPENSACWEGNQGASPVTICTWRADKLVAAFDGFMNALMHGDQTDCGVWRERLRGAVKEASDDLKGRRP